MPNWLIALLFAVGIAAWVYTILVRSGGNAVPSRNFAGAGIAGLVVFVLMWTLLKFVLSF